MFSDHAKHLSTPMHLTVVKEVPTGSMLVLDIWNQNEVLLFYSYTQMPSQQSVYT